MLKRELGKKKEYVKYMNIWKDFKKNENAPAEENLHVSLLFHDFVTDVTTNNSRETR